MRKLAYLSLLVASAAFAVGSVTVDDFPNGIRTPTLTVTGSLSVAGGSVVSLSLGTANGLSLSSGVLSLGLADGTHAGALDFNAQNIGGAKTFLSNISASNLSGTNSGDVTLGTANGLSLTGQALSLGAADATHPGALTSGTQTIGGAKTLAAAATLSAGAVYTPQTLSTCGASLEGAVQTDSASGASTTHRTRLCYCTSNGSAVYAWQNTVSGTVGNTTTCAD